MSDYTVQIDWSGKDSLPDSSADKIISGADFQTEFDAIELASATKANLNGSATESFSAATPGISSNTTDVVTTAWFRDTGLKAAYPVGSIYMNATNSTNPGTLLGFGTWVSFGEGRMLVGLDSTDTDFDTAEEEGGSKTHTLTVDEMPSHTHTYTRLNYNPVKNIDYYETLGKFIDDANPTTTDTSNATGGDQAHSILNPYVVVYMWKRTA